MFSKRTSFVMLAAASMAFAGCGDALVDNNAASADGAEKVVVTSTKDKCELSTTTIPGGTVTFSVTNEGDEITEFYLLAEDGLRVVGEVENIGPKITRDLIVLADEGKYVTACKPGMIGDGIRADFTITKPTKEVKVSPEDSELKENATKLYAGYVRDQVGSLVKGTDDFVAAYLAGDTKKAKELYAPVRMHWERIEPVAESFGDLDPKLDLREADLEEGQEWSGWHLIEKDLWPPADGYTPLSDDDKKKYTDMMIADTKTLNDKVQTEEYGVDSLGNGAKELLDEVAQGKVTGEEEFWSHTDLWDFQANIDGARVAYENLKPLVDKRDKKLSDKIAKEFKTVQGLLDSHKDGDGWKLYNELSKDEINELATAVDALGESLGNLTKTVVD